MLALETKQSGGKLLPHSVLRDGGECFQGKHRAEGKEGWPRIGTGGGRLLSAVTNLQVP